MKIANEPFSAITETSRFEERNAQHFRTPIYSCWEDYEVDKRHGKALHGVWGRTAVSMTRRARAQGFRGCINTNFTLQTACTHDPWRTHSLTPLIIHL